MTKVPITFEDQIDLINREISKRKFKWTLDAIAWMDFDDVAQTLRIHIHKKWAKYDQSRPFLPWVNRVIGAQITNLLKNLYSNYSKPCQKCDESSNTVDNGCGIYGTQCSNCPAFKKWEKLKKDAYNSKLPLSIENHLEEVNDKPEDAMNMERATINLHEVLKRKLNEVEWQVYKILYIDKHQNLGDDELVSMLVQKLGSQIDTKTKIPRQKQIQSIKKDILRKARSLVYAGEVDL